MTDGEKLQLASQQGRQEFMLALAELRERLTVAEVTKDVAGHLRSRPQSLAQSFGQSLAQSLGGRGRPSAVQTVISTVAVLAFGRMLRPFFGKGKGKGRSSTVKSRNK